MVTRAEGLGDQQRPCPSPAAHFQSLPVWCPHPCLAGVDFWCFRLADAVIHITVTFWVSLFLPAWFPLLS